MIETWHRKHSQKRRQSGSMLMMTVMSFGLILLTFMVGFAFYMLLTEQQRGQAVTDGIALSISKEMNAGDRAGQLNNLIALNRELVYASRQISDITAGQRDLNFAQPLSYQLLAEARNNQVLLEKARVDQMNDIMKASRYAVDKYNLNTKTTEHFRLPWWQSYDPQVIQVNLGYVANTSSNVLHNDYFYDLTNADQQDHLVHPRSNLYQGNINAKLFQEDSDLDYFISSLAAPVDQTVSPARLMNAEVFRKLVTTFAGGKWVLSPLKQLPSAVQVMTTMKVSSNTNKGTVEMGSVAACTGAMDVPPARFYATDDPAPTKGWGNGPAWGSGANNGSKIDNTVYPGAR